jgi:hypothetical protein
MKTTTTITATKIKTQQQHGLAMRRTFLSEETSLIIISHY